MVRAFSLAGLLRMRHAEQDIAGANLARTNARVRDNATTEKRARRALMEFGGASVTSVSTENLRAIAASRLASAVMLHELTALQEQTRLEQVQAQLAYSAARMKSLGLEKLEAKHDARVRREDLRAEQIVLDEVAGRRGRNDGETS